MRDTWKRKRGFLYCGTKGEKLPLLCGILFQKEIHGDREIPVEAFLLLIWTMYMEP